MTAPEHTEDDAVAEVMRILREHAGHIGAGGNLWNADCLSIDCSWAAHGRGTMLHARNAHGRHLAETIVAAARAEAVAGVLALADELDEMGMQPATRATYQHAARRIRAAVAPHTDTEDGAP